ncbi:zinc finger BED domain-containing protein 4-like [Neoarius graeffei]|uniref:zinc finger BED domain-containing protein 4-like n=1 Tax=Neoarius graeffei TaxID=443677 RepID=UPI00298CD872|nr:zinc finger BED domain-containing protein 4-like [Neoarius graeffei]
MTSPVWTFFKVSEADVKLAVCNVCNDAIPRGGSTPRQFNTTNLIRHLRIRHSTEYAEYEKLVKPKATGSSPSPSQPTLSESLHRREPYSRESKRWKDITSKVMEFVCLGEQPLSVVEEKSFRRMMTCLDPRYDAPSRRYLTDVCLPQLYQTVYAHIETLLKANVSISFTSDIWSADACPMSLLSLTAHFIDANFERHNIVLHCQEFTGSHSAEALVGAYRCMFQSWGIQTERIHAILTDNAKNMQKAMRDADFPGLPCMAHTLQLAVHEGILSQRSISDIVASGRRIVGHFKHSPLAYSRLESCQKQLGQPIKKLRQDVPTRWNSSFYMLQSLLEQKLALASYAAEYELPCNFTVHQWKLIENTITILAPFEELTKEISSSTASAADVIPCIRALTRLLEKTTETDHGVKTAKSVLLEAVRRRFADIDAQKLYTIATMLDPRYKDRYFSEALKPSFHEQLQNALETSHPELPITTSTVEQPSSSKSTDKTPPACSLQAMFAELVDEVAGQSEQEITIITQVSQYMAESVLQRSSNPLAYWQLNKGRFPALAQTARAYLCSPCTSVDSERLFSTAANIIDDKRNRLTPKNAEMLIMIKRNLPHVIGQ